jgi:hypothetical protein
VTHLIPEIPGVLTADEALASARHLTRLQRPNGMIPWFPGGHCDPWNHVETAMALDVAGFHDEAFAAYRWLVDTQLPNGAWHNYYTYDGGIEEAKLDTNVVAYIATGAWHHWLCTQSKSDVEALWPAVERALAWVLGHRRDDGLVLWAVEADDTRTWDYALLTGSSSIAHALICGDQLGRVLGHRRPTWVRAADVIIDAIVNRPEAFEPKDRFAMDWYYPVLSGAMDVSAGKARLADGWATYVMDGLGTRCVSDEPWVTASETAETAIAFATIGDFATATDLLGWTRTHRREDGSYWTGIVYPDGVVFPFEEHTSYTAAAVILAADAITGAGPAAHVFTAAELFD